MPPFDPTPTPDTIPTKTVADPVVRTMLRGFDSGMTRSEVFNIGNVPFQTYSEVSEDSPVQRLYYATAGAASGAFTLGWRGERRTVLAEHVTSSLNHNATKAQLLSALEALPNCGVGNVEVGGGPTMVEGFTVRFKNAAAGTDKWVLSLYPKTNTVVTAGAVPVDIICEPVRKQDDVTFLYSLACLSIGSAAGWPTETIQTVSVSGVGIGGTFTLDFSGSVEEPHATVTTATIAYNASESAFKTALIGVAGGTLLDSDSVRVVRTAITNGYTWTIYFGWCTNYSGPSRYSNHDVNLLIVNTGGLTGSPTTDVQKTVTGSKGWDTTLWQTVDGGFQYPGDHNWWQLLREEGYMSNGPGIFRDFGGGAPADPVVDFCDWLEPHLRWYIASSVARQQFNSTNFTDDAALYAAAARYRGIIIIDEENWFPGFDLYTDGITKSVLWGSTINGYAAVFYKRSLDRWRSQQFPPLAESTLEEAQEAFYHDAEYFYRFVARIAREVCPNHSGLGNYLFPFGGTDGCWNQAYRQFYTPEDEWERIPIALRWMHRRWCDTGIFDFLNPNFYNYYRVYEHRPTFTADAGTNVLTHTTDAADVPTGTPVNVETTGTLPGGLSANTLYWVIRQSASSSKLAATIDQAFANDPIDITSTGTGTHYMNLGQVPLNSHIAGRGLYAQECGALVDEYGMRCYATCRSRHEPGGTGAESSGGWADLAIAPADVKWMIDMLYKAKVTKIVWWDALIAFVEGSVTDANTAWVLNQVNQTNTYIAGVPMTEQDAIDVNNYFIYHHNVMFEDATSAQLLMNIMRTPVV